jgi:hypothetical protein
VIWLRRTALGGFVVAVALAWWWVPLALRPVAFFGVRRVDVTGTRYLTPEAVVRAMALRPSASVFDDAHVLEGRLMQTGALMRVRVRRRLPATLAVEIVEKEPVALAESPAGLVPLARDGRALPYDLARAPVDAPIVAAADGPLLEALGRIQAADVGLFGDVVSARARGGEVVLDVSQGGGGRVRLDETVDPEVVHAVSAVRRDLRVRGIAWRELDGRFKGWVVVRKA